MWARGLVIECWPLGGGEAACLSYFGRLGRNFLYTSFSTKKVSEIFYISDSNLGRVRKSCIRKIISPNLAEKRLESPHMEKISPFRGRNAIYMKNQTLLWLGKMIYEKISPRLGSHFYAFDFFIN